MPRTLGPSIQELIQIPWHFCTDPIRKVSLATATPTSAFVYVDETQLSQMLINLFNNEVSSPMQSQELSTQTANP